MGDMGAALLTLTRSTHQHHQQQLQHQQQGQNQQPQRTGSLSPAAAALLKQRAQSSSHHKQPPPPGRLAVRAQHIPAAPAAAVVNLSGAGDTLIGGVAAALVAGRDPLHALAVGVAAAAVSVQCTLNVPAGPSEGFVFEAVEQAGLQLLSKQQVWEFAVQSTL